MTVFALSGGAWPSLQLQQQYPDLRISSSLPSSLVAARVNGSSVSLQPAQSSISLSSAPGSLVCRQASAPAPRVSLQRRDVLTRSQASFAPMDDDQVRERSPDNSPLRKEFSIDSLQVVQETEQKDLDAGILHRQLAERDLIISGLNQQVKQLGKQLAGTDGGNGGEPSKSWKALVGSIISDLREAIDSQGQEMQMLHKTVQDQSLETGSLRIENVQLKASIQDLQTRVTELEPGDLVRRSRYTMDANIAESGLKAYSSEQAAQENVFILESSLVEAVSADEQVSCFQVFPAKQLTAPKDLVDQRLQEYLASRPDFPINIEKMKTGWYVFGEPVSKKLYLKVTGDHVVCRVGGGHKELFAYLDEHWFALQERVDSDSLALRATRNSRTQYADPDHG